MASLNGRGSANLARLGAKRLGAKHLGVVLGDQAALPCLAMSFGTRLRWRARPFGISGCVFSATRSESWLLPALTGEDVVAGQRRRADRCRGQRRGRSAHDGLIVLTGQRHPAALAIAARAPH